MNPLESNDVTPSRETFVTTRWTQVMAARGDSAEARNALGELCATYYAPVVAFLRREGRTEDTARELAHEFFAQVLAGRAFANANPERGRFRSYLLGALRNFLANDRLRAGREKRGGQIVHQPLALETDGPGAAEIPATHHHAADTEFDREWALSLLAQALKQLEFESREHGSGREFEILKPWLTGETTGQSQAEAARVLACAEGAVRVAIHRLRRRFRALVKSELARTVHDPQEVADELRYLIEVLS
ncbi:MAG: ECF-type sigma factor [Verrucomicrobiota bacterium]